MSIHRPSNRAALRAIVVIALSLFVICIAAPDIRRLWQPFGIFGYGTNLDGVVTSVDANSPAADAGIQLGDRVDESLTPPQFRWFVVQIAVCPQPGVPISFDLIHNGSHRTVTLIAVPEAMSNAHRVVIAIKFALTILVVAIGAVVVLLLPNPTTWGFFLFCLATMPPWVNAFFLYTPMPTRYVLLGFAYIIVTAGSIGLLIFAFRFLREPVEGWRLFGLRTMLYAFALLLILNEWSFYQTNWFGGPPAEVLNRIQLYVGWLISLVALYAFVDTYLRARGVDRQRIQWVVIGFGISLVASPISSFITTELTNYPLELSEAVGLLGAAAPIMFAYAIIRHRVIDVSFVVNRALVYGVLTTLLVGAFSVIDWLFIDKLKLARVGTLAEMGVAVAGGFWFNGLHKRVDSFIDAVFFRQRHKAEVQLARVAAALPLATTTSAVAECLVSEPVQAMSLASAALFRCNRDSVYMREQSEGWDIGDLSELDDSDERLLMLARAEGGPLSLYEHRWRTQNVPPGPAHPVLVLPIIVRHELAAVVFYGAHVHGEALDPDEIETIAGLASGAATAYDHLDAESMKRKVDSLTSENESLRSLLPEAYIQPA